MVPSAAELFQLYVPFAPFQMGLNITVLHIQPWEPKVVHNNIKASALFFKSCSKNASGLSNLKWEAKSLPSSQIHCILF